MDSASGVPLAPDSVDRRLRVHRHGRSEDNIAAVTEEFRLHLLHAIKRAAWQTVLHTP